MGKLIDLTGQKFGDLTVIRKSEKRGECAIWVCACSCGNIKEIKSSSLLIGSTKSCGCGMQKTMFKVSHGMCHTKEYGTWRGIISRALAKEARYKNYLSRGICESWLNSFEEFYKDMGNAPSKNHTIERIDNSIGYFPGNCKWATQKEQNRNYSQNIFMTKDGKTACATEWAEFYGVDRHAIYRRIKKGVSHDEIFKYLEQKRLG